MGCLCDWQIERDVVIEPFQKEQCSKGVISYGLSSMGYDVRIGYKFKVFTNTFSTHVDPKNFNAGAFVDVDLTPQEVRGNQIITQNFVLIPPNSFALGESVETITIPRDVIGICLGKSTYHRCGIIVACTPLECEWHGKVTIEISNTTPLPARIYAGEGIMQVIFLRTDGLREKLQGHWSHLLIDETGMLWSEADEELEKKVAKKGSCRVSYADRKGGGGRYQNQTGITLPFVKE